MTAVTATRDPLPEQALTPQNAALAVIDYQPLQFSAVRSMDTDLLLENIVSTVTLATRCGRATTSTP